MLLVQISQHFSKRRIAVSRWLIFIHNLIIQKYSDPKCTFETQNLASQTVGLFPSKCSTVCSHLLITKYTDLTQEKLAITFLNMKRLIGSISVAGTKFKNVSFLAGLESIDCGRAVPWRWICCEHFRKLLGLY